MSSSSPNYASIFGIHSVAGAVIFAVAYAPYVALFTYKLIRTPTYVLFIISLFCSIREVAFIIRALMADSDNFGSNLGLYIADQVLFGSGFFGLLYSAYTLVMDRELASDLEPPQGVISTVTRNRILFRLVLTTGVVLGIIGATKGTSVDSTDSERSQGHTLRVASTIVFLVLTILQAYRTLLFTRAEHLAYSNSSSRMRATHGNWILCVISLLLLIRECYSMAGAVHQDIQFNEALWYPLSAVPEVLVVFLFTTPGLVPTRSKLQPTNRSEIGLVGQSRC